MKNNRNSIVIGLIMMVCLASCIIKQAPQDYIPMYEDRNHSTEIYYWSNNGLGNSPYWGYYTGFYYYYGIPHYYPWWYYYQCNPPHNHYTHTHVYVQCNDGYYVYGPPNRKFNNSKPSVMFDLHYEAAVKPITNKSKTNVFPSSWKPSNPTGNNKTQNNDNRIYAKPSTQYNTPPTINNGNKNRVNRPTPPKVNRPTHPKVNRPIPPKVNTTKTNVGNRGKINKSTTNRKK